MTILEAFQLRSLGIRPCGDSSTRTAAETLVTIAGGLGNVLSSVRFSWVNRHRKITKEYYLFGGMEHCCSLVSDHLACNAQKSKMD